MQLFVKPANGKTITLDVNENYTINDLKSVVLDKLNIPIVKQRLIYKGNYLKYEHKSLKDYHINHLDAITVVISLDAPSTAISKHHLLLQINIPLSSFMK